MGEGIGTCHAHAGQGGLGSITDPIPVRIRKIGRGPGRACIDPDRGVRLVGILDAIPITIEVISVADGIPIEIVRQGGRIQLIGPTSQLGGIRIPVAVIILVTDQTAGSVRVHIRESVPIGIQRRGAIEGVGVRATTDEIPICIPELGRRPIAEAIPIGVGIEGVGPGVVGVNVCTRTRLDGIVQSIAIIVEVLEQTWRHTNRIGATVVARREGIGMPVTVRILEHHQVEDIGERG